MRKVCTLHDRGVDIGQPPFFEPKCAVCQQKLRDGKVTGSEPRPSDIWKKKVNYSRAKEIIENSRKTGRTRRIARRMTAIRRELQ